MPHTITAQTCCNTDTNRRDYHDSDEERVTTEDVEGVDFEEGLYQELGDCEYVDGVLADTEYEWE